MAPVKTPQETRHYILSILDKCRPVGASDELLSTSLMGIGLASTDSEIRVQLDYLRQKGYVEHEAVEDRFTKISRNISRLTAKGIDLLEGNIPRDPGIGLTE